MDNKLLELFCLVYVAIIVACTYGCYSTLQANKRSLSHFTLRLYRTLVNSLVIDLVFCLLIGVTPLLLMFVGFTMRTNWASTVTVVCSTFTSLYFLVSHVLWLFYIAPYRRAVLGLVGVSTKRRSTVVIVTQHSRGFVSRR